MAALDFGMAMARGMLPTSEKAQKDLLNLAGGRNIFKSEDWWNQAVDKQISSGYREATPETRYLMPSGEYKPAEGVNVSYGRMIMGQFSPVSGQFGMPYQPSYSPIFGYGGGISRRESPIVPKGAVTERTYKPGRGFGDDYITKQFDTFADSKRKDYTAGELADIERSAEAGAKRTKAQSEASKASQRRLRRGTGGLVGKARLPGDAPSTGLPELGTTGLGMTAGLFGADIKL
jgi:hypothetical protein